MSLPVRDPLSDHLLMPENAGLIVIDYQIVPTERLLKE
jgi:hypothetical protein